MRFPIDHSKQLWSVATAAVASLALVASMISCLWWYRMRHRRSVFTTSLSATAVVKNFFLRKDSETPAVHLNYESPVTLQRFHQIVELEESRGYPSGLQKEPQRLSEVHTDDNGHQHHHLDGNSSMFIPRTDDISASLDTADKTVLESSTVVTKVPLALAMVIANEQVMAHSVSFTPPSVVDPPGSFCVGGDKHFDSKTHLTSICESQSDMISRSIAIDKSVDELNIPHRSASPYFSAIMSPVEERRIIHSDRTQL